MLFHIIGHNDAFKPQRRAQKDALYTSKKHIDSPMHVPPWSLSLHALSLSLSLTLALSLSLTLSLLLFSLLFVDLSRFRLKRRSATCTKHANHNTTEVLSRFPPPPPCESNNNNILLYSYYYSTLLGSTATHNYVFP